MVCPPVRLSVALVTAAQRAYGPGVVETSVTTVLVAGFRYLVEWSFDNYTIDSETTTRPVMLGIFPI